MLTKIIIFTALILPVGAANTDDEIIKNLDFFQSMEMLKEEAALAVSSSAAETENNKNEVKKSDPEKK